MCVNYTHGIGRVTTGAAFRLLTPGSKRWQFDEKKEETAIGVKGVNVFCPEWVYFVCRLSHSIMYTFRFRSLSFGDLSSSFSTCLNYPRLFRGDPFLRNLTPSVPFQLSQTAPPTLTPFVGSIPLTVRVSVLVLTRTRRTRSATAAVEWHQPLSLDPYQFRRTSVTH